MNLGTLVSETRNPQTMDLDALPTPELVKRFNEQDTLVAEAVKATLPDVAPCGGCRGGGAEVWRTYHLYGRGHQWSAWRTGCLRMPPDVWRSARSGRRADCRRAGRVVESGRRRGRQPTGRRRRSCRTKSARTGSGRGARGVGSYTLL
ncbi:phophosugar binding protein [Salmonella enterica subsp. enterica]|uniref:Phophosugar binding protein n=1 Tax=Salmonella enterica I TaxID=59201 RepID=A0A447PBD5_SALET|nr:phophosugar binding protein [Salmonella enterica subsp. enterica]